MSKYRYLLWDIDGTVLDFKAAEKAAIKQLFIKFGFGECPDEKIRVYSEINSGYWKKLEKNEIAKPEMLVARFRDSFSVMDIDVSQAEAFNSAYQIALGDTVVFCDDAFSILESEKGKFVLVAVTNGTEVAQRKKLKMSGLDKIFDYVFISDVVGTEKPNSGFFDAVFSGVGIEDKSEVLIIGDSLTGDIKGGNNYGIDSCWYNPSHSENKTEILPDYIISDIHEIGMIIG